MVCTCDALPPLHAIENLPLKIHFDHSFIHEEADAILVRGQARFKNEKETCFCLNSVRSGGSFPQTSEPQHGRATCFCLNSVKVAGRFSELQADVWTRREDCLRCHSGSSDGWSSDQDCDRASNPPSREAF